MLVWNKYCLRNYINNMDNVVEVHVSDSNFSYNGKACCLVTVERYSPILEENVSEQFWMYDRR